MIKKILLLVVGVCLAVAGYSQTLPAERVVVSESIVLRKQPIDTIAQDTSYATLLRTRAIPSMAVIRQVLNRMSTAAGITNIGQGTPNSNNISITSSSGTGTTLLAATQTVAGIMSALDKFYLDSSIQSLEVSNDTLFFVKRGVRTFGVVLPGGFDAGALRQVLNLADLTDVAVARQNLGLGSGALLDTAATGDAGANQLVKGNDSRLTGGRVPTGPAGGDLTGTYPNPTLTNTGVTPGLYTNANVAVDAKGRIIGISSGAGNPGDTTVYITPGANISITGIGASFNPYVIAGKSFVDSVTRSNDSVYYWIGGVKTFGFLDRGTVESVATGFGISGGPITTTGTLALDSANAALKAYILKYGTDSSWVYVNYLPQDPSTIPHSEGRFFYDNDNKTLTLYDNQVGTSIQLGKENIIDARNNTGSTILDGQVVRITGATGSNPTIGLAKGSTPDSAQVVGLATHNISNGTIGKVVTFGLLNDVNTSSFSEGDALWLSATTAGAVTNVQPGYPNIAVFLGYVLRSHASQGKILVTPERGQRGGDTLIFENGLVDADHTPLVRAINDTTVEVATIGVLPGVFTAIAKDSVAGQRDWTVNLDTASAGLKAYVAQYGGGGSGSDVEILGDTALRVGSDTVQLTTNIEYDFPDSYIDSLGPNSYLINILQLIKDSSLQVADIPDATPSIRGLVNTGTQLFGGRKNFRNGITIGDSIPDVVGQNRSLIRVATGAFGGDDAGYIYAGTGINVGQGIFDNFFNIQPSSTHSLNFKNSVGVTAINLSDSLFFNIYPIVDSKIRFQYSSGRSTIFPKTDGRLYYTNPAGVEYDLTATTPTTDYIRNQIAARENKNAYINISRADSIYTPKLTLGAYAQDNIRPIFRGIDSGSTGGYEGYLYQREGYTNRIVDRIRRANGSYQSPTTTAKGNPLYTLQIEARGASSWLSAIPAYNILAKTDPIAGSSLTPSIAHSISLRNSGYLGMFFDSTGLRLGIDTFTVNGDAKSTIDLLGSFGKRFRSVAGTGESAGARDNTIYITATFDYTLTLPDARLSPRREYIIKRVDTLLTKAVIKPFSGQKIDGQDSIVLFRNQSYVVASDSTGWQIIAGRETPLHQDEWKARNGISYFQEFISNTAFADGYLVPTSNGSGAGVGRTGNIPVALRATNRVGVTAYRTGTTTTGRAGYVSDLNIGENLVLGAGITVFETTVAFPNLSDGTDRYQALFGFGDAPSSVNQSDGIYFLYDEGGVSTGSTASANWQVATASGGSITITATSIPVAANQWYRLRIELNFNATRVYFYIDGNLVGQTTLTIPSGTGGNGTNFLNQIYKSAGTTDRIALVDYLLFNMRFNTPRY